MILAQVFKTAEGAHTRCRNENALSKTHRFLSHRYRDGRKDLIAYNPDHADRYTWRIEKVKR